MKLVKILSMLVVLVSVATVSGPGLSDTWRGTAPFCEGACLPGERQIGTSDYGDGAYCVTGKKVLCSNSSQMCRSTSTKAECYGVVMICENGYSETTTGVWKGCNSYACGVCIGFGESGVSILSNGSGSGSAGWAAIPCAQGYVWRESFQGDYVCVPPASRSRAQADNAAAAGRLQAGGVYCVSGYVWREAGSRDRVCVPPQTRAETWEENRLAASRIQTARVVANTTCKSGFVWREALQNDHVCVTPQTRQQTRNDNAQAASRVEPGSDRCKPGFVWREVVPSDHVCVPPATRAAASADNALAPQRVANR